jgi:hypothetical protein
MAKKSKNPRLVLVESTESEAAIRAKIPDKKVVSVDLWVRTPDSEKLEAMTVAARLCGCRRICLAVVEDQL